MHVVKGALHEASILPMIELLLQRTRQIAHDRAAELVQPTLSHLDEDVDQGTNLLRVLYIVLAAIRQSHSNHALLQEDARHLDVMVG